MFQLNVGHSQMHPLLFYIPASVIGQETGCGFTNVRRYKLNFLAFFSSLVRKSTDPCSWLLFCSFLCMATEIDSKQLKALFPVQHEQGNSES